MDSGEILSQGMYNKTLNCLAETEKKCSQKQIYVTADE